MNRERSKKLLKRTGLAVLKRPDGGVVTQRTANPLSLAHFLDSSLFSPSVPRMAFQGLMRSSANRASDTRRMVETRSGSMRSTSSAVRRMRPEWATLPLWEQNSTGAGTDRHSSCWRVQGEPRPLSIWRM
jgi:hypothetical protein